MADGLLYVFRALDVTDEKDFIVGKILAALGVETIKIELPAGDPSRNIHSFCQDTSDPEQSLYRSALNTDKRRLTLNLESNQGQDKNKKSVKTAGFVLESSPTGHMASLGLGYKECSEGQQIDVSFRRLLPTEEPWA